MEEHAKLSSATALAKGLEALITPVVEDCDKHVEEVLASQASLSTNIDRLTRVVGRLLENTPEPLGAAHTAKLQSIRQRVAAVGVSVTAVQARIAKLHAMKAQLPQLPGAHITTAADAADDDDDDTVDV